MKKKGRIAEQVLSKKLDQLRGRVSLPRAPVDEGEGGTKVPEKGPILAQILTKKTKKYEH